MEDRNQGNFDWVNVTEACEILGISRHTLHRLVAEEYLPAYRIKGVRSMQFKREDVLALIERVDPGELEKERGDVEEQN